MTHRHSCKVIGHRSLCIRRGKGDMPSQGDRAKDDDVWNLVNHIRSMAKK
jgi:hypothetical protein